MSFFKRLFCKKVNHIELVKNGATLIDVRTTEEFNETQIKNAINIPLDTIHNNISKIKKMPRPIVVFCKSGIRSSRARAILKNEGISEVYNGGGYNNFL